MANLYSWLFLMICATLLVMSSSPTAVVDAGGMGMGMGMEWISNKSTCKGSIADCMEERDEFELDSEINRRILATTQYISYGALQRNTVPCSRRGASYYNCRPGAQANPYSRGCSAITRCRS
ncbi:rapid alkalinization factor [Gastrolobium bilobum]|uniref:rapid alkalinization factor n=1 Tax=Gastrolobium bilobum TaxID=150636 RepID=UPI002AAF37F5|nr:rapid alkalinization factor [Gastrolobium bilobum]